MRNIQKNQLRVPVRLIWFVLIFGWNAGFFAVTYGYPLPVVTPENLQDDPDPIIENIILRESRSGFSTVIVTFASENAAERSQHNFYFLARLENDDHLAKGGLLLSHEPSISDNQVLLFLLNHDYVPYTNIIYHKSSDSTSMVFRLSDWIDWQEGGSDPALRQKAEEKKVKGLIKQEMYTYLEARYPHLEWEDIFIGNLREVDGEWMAIVLPSPGIGDAFNVRLSGDGEFSVTGTVGR